MISEQSVNCSVGTAMVAKNPRVGILLAFVCLTILGIMPIISNSRPMEFDALSFAFCLLVWKLFFSLPLFAVELRGRNKGIFGAHLTRAFRNRTIVIILCTGTMFGLSTYAYVLAFEKAGAASAAIALQAYPLFAILWETLFLGRRKTRLELLFTLLLLAAMYYLGTGGTWRISGLSVWFLFALTVPFLWSVAHVIIKEVLDRTPITPSQVTVFRVLVSVLFLGAVVLAVDGPAAVWRSLGDPVFQAFAIVMGLVYYLELINWFYAVRHIDVSVASSITVPAPALTMVLAVLFLGDRIAPYQVVALGFVILSVYGLLFAGARKAQPA